MTSAPKSSEGRREWQAHWRVPVAAAAAVMASLIHFGTLGVFLPAIEAETGWSRSGITLGMMIFSIESTVTAPFVGMLVDRFGPRRVGIPGLVIYLTAVALLGLVGQSIWMWWGVWMLVGIGDSLAKFNVWTTAVSRHFDKARGMAIAVALAGTSISGMAMPLLAALALKYADWRTGYVAIACLQAVIALPLVIRWLSDGERPPAPTASATVETVGPSLAQLLKSRLFLIFATICAATFMPLSGLNVHFVPILRENGIAAELAAGLAAAIGAASLAGQALSGGLLDRFRGQFVLAAFLLLGIAAVIALLISHLVWAGIFAAITFGLLSGAAPASVAYLCSRHFELRFYGTILASLGGVMSLSAGLGSVIAGAVFDRFGSYTPLILAALPLFGLAIIMNITLGGRPVEREPSGYRHGAGLQRQHTGGSN